MSELIQEYTAEVRDDAGRLYAARRRGDTGAVGQWQGWIEFLPREGEHRIDATIGSVS
jgi:hypothetical protein